MKVYLIGPFPPPYGGISIHIKRLFLNLYRKRIETYIYAIYSRKDQILNSKYAEVITYTNMKKALWKILFIGKNDIVHSHMSTRFDKIMLGFLSLVLKKKIIVTFHGNGIKTYYNKSSWLMKKILCFSLRKLSAIIVVNSDLKQYLVELRVPKDKIFVVPSYINPVINEEDYLKIDTKIWDFIKNAKKKNKFILTGNGNIRFYYNQDLYGLDLLIDLVKELKQDGYKISLIFALLGYSEQTAEERKYFESLLSRIQKYNLQEDIFIYKTKNTEYYPILEKSDIFIRPTNTDGYGISVVEALFLEKPAIASNVCNRAKGTVLFENRNLKDLESKTKFILDNYEEQKDRIKKIHSREYVNEVIEVYKKICGDGIES